MSSNNLSKRMIPKRLEDELNNAPKFKPSIPPRRTVAEMMTDSVETAMYDEMFGSLISRKSTDMTPKLAAALSANASAAQSSSIERQKPAPDLTVSLLARLTDCESELKLNRRQLAEKLRRITELEDENKELRRQLQAPDSVYEELDFVRGQNDDLIAKLQEMEQFLSDYGLVWVGNSSNSSELQQATSASEMGSGVSYALFSKKIDELNNMINSEPTQVVTDEKGRKARLVRASEILEQVRVVFYKNGLMVRRGPFRECASDSYKSFTRDILDGYFPSEFKIDYPDGVVFVLIDKHEQMYDSSRPDDAASADAKMTAAQFLQKLPRTVIRNGEIIDVRDSIQSKLTGDPASSSTSASAKDDKGSIDVDQNTGVNQPAPSQPKKREQVTLTSEGFESGDASPVTVQVRWMDGSVVILKMVQSETVGHIRRLLVEGIQVAQRTNSSQLLQEFELRSVWPARRVDDACTLQEAGVVPSGTLHAFKI